jgi:hypothetical protein
MNTIEHEGKTYEVLPLDRISEITHAKLAGGKVVETTARSNGTIYMLSTIDYVDGTLLNASELEDFGIQPLRLAPKEPVTFEATFEWMQDGLWYPCHYLDDALGSNRSNLKRFRCVEIVEEEAQAILKAKGVE